MSINDSENSHSEPLKNRPPLLRGATSGFVDKIVPRQAHQSATSTLFNNSPAQFVADYLRRDVQGWLHSKLGRIAAILYLLLRCLCMRWHDAMAPCHSHIVTHSCFLIYCSKLATAQYSSIRASSSGLFYAILNFTVCQFRPNL